MSRAPVPDCMLVCSHCPAGPDGRPPVVQFHADQQQVRCQACRRWYRVTTRTLAGATLQEPIGDGISRYRLTTLERGERQRQRMVTAPAGLRLVTGERISLVFHGGRLTGVANQTSETWFRADVRKTRRGAHGAEMVVLALAGLLALWLGAMTLGQIAGSPGVGVLAVILMGALAAPWLAETLRGDPGRVPVERPADAGEKGSVNGPRA